MRRHWVIVLAAGSGAAVAIIGMKLAPYSSSVANVLYAPTQTATPTDTPMPTPTETPDPNPLNSSCAVYRLAGARLLDAYDEKSHVDSDELGMQYGLAEAIVMLAVAAHDRGCGSEWTDLRRRFSFVGDQIDKQFENAEELYLIQNDYDQYAVKISNNHRCGFYLSADGVVLTVESQANDAPDKKLLSTIWADFHRLYWEGAQRQLHCGEEGKKKRAARMPR